MQKHRKAAAAAKDTDRVPKEVRSSMDNRELAALHSKLIIYRNGLQTAKAKGDLDKARQWLEGIASLKKKIAHEAAQPHG